MANNKVVIDIEARLVDRVSGDAKKVEKNIDNLEKKAEKAKKSLNDLGKTTAKPKMEANTSKFERAMNKAQKMADKFGRTKSSAVLDTIDRASSKFQKVSNKFKEFGGKTYRSILSVHDSNAMSTIKKVASAGRGIAGATWRATVSIADMATSPLRRIKDSLFSIKGLVTAITAGFATQQAVIKPISVADQYSSAKIGFTTLLGGEQQGQAMMDDLDQFAKKTPFNTTNVIANAQKMMAMGWESDSILKDMEIIGNAAAATGKLDVGLESIVRAMSQIKTKGKLSAEELNQLSEAGISAKAMLAEELGYGTGDKGLAAFSKDQEDGKIGAERALSALLSAMEKKYSGMMDSMANETAEGLISQLKDAFEINVVRRWGQGLQEGAKKGLGSILELLDKSEKGLESVGDTLFELGSEISNKAAEGLDKVIQKILKVTESDEFKNADIGEKIHIMWDQVVAEPLSEWWEGTGKAKVAGVAEKIGAGLGTGIGNVFKGLFGVADDVGDGAVTVGSSFAKGFLDGFDAGGVANAIYESFKSFFKEHPIAGTLLGAHVLNTALSPFGGTMAVAGAGRAAVRGAGGLTGILGSTGNAMVAGSGIKGMLAGAGYALNGGASVSTLSGGAAALLGGGSILGGVLGAVGIGSGIKDIYNGTKSKGKEAQDSYFKGGSKLGLVGTGAAAGAAIGSVVPVVGTAAGALIGAGVGGVGALLGGNKMGEGLSDAWDSAKAFFTETLPAKWDELKESASVFFTETLPTKWDELKESASVFFTETLPFKLGEMIGEAGIFFTETLPSAWDTVKETASAFFTETLPEAWNSVKETASTFFTETLPSAWDAVKETASLFFTETLPSAWDAVKETASAFFTETLPAAWDSTTSYFKEKGDQIAEGWDGVKSYFKEKADAIGSWFSEKKASISNSWNSWWDNFKEGKENAGNNASGGLIQGRQLSWLGEEGTPEMVIPLGANRRKRGIELWTQAGRFLGVSGFADGGMAGTTPKPVSPVNREESRPSAPAPTSGGAVINVTVGDINLEVKAEAGQNILDSISAQKEQLADEIASVINKAIEAMYQNMPARGGA